MCQIRQPRARRKSLRRKPRRMHHGQGKNAWKPTPASLLKDIQKAFVEHGHGGLWNSMDYDMRDVVSIDIKACYPASFQGMGEAKPYFERFGHPTHHMTRVAINGALPRDVGTGFAEDQEWEFVGYLSSLPGLEGILQMPVGLRRRSWCSLWSLAC